MSATNPHPSGIETTLFNFCPHCGGRLDRGLAQHMANGLCDSHTSGSERVVAPAQPQQEYQHMPALEDHDEREHVDDDLEERRKLADELTAEGVWVDEVEV